MENLTPEQQEMIALFEQNKSKEEIMQIMGDRYHTAMQIEVKGYLNLYHKWRSDRMMKQNEEYAKNPLSREEILAQMKRMSTKLKLEDRYTKEEIDAARDENGNIIIKYL